MVYTADSIRDSIRIQIVTPDSIRIRFKRKWPIRRSLGWSQRQLYIWNPRHFHRALMQNKGVSLETANVKGKVERKI